MRSSPTAKVGFGTACFAVLMASLALLAATSGPHNHVSATPATARHPRPDVGGEDTLPTTPDIPMPQDQDPVHAPTPTVRELAFEGSWKLTSADPTRGAVIVFRFPAKDARKFATADLEQFARDGYALLHLKGGDVIAIKFTDPD
jgi:hypothetical protein